MEFNTKTVFAMFVVSVVAILQVVAWIMGFNGQVFAFTSMIIGLVTGSCLGFKFPKLRL